MLIQRHRYFQKSKYEIIGIQISFGYEKKINLISKNSNLIQN